LQVPSSANGLLDALLEKLKPERRRQLSLLSNKVDMIWKLCGSADQFLRGVFDDISRHIVVCPSAFVVAAYLMEIMARRCKLVDAIGGQGQDKNPDISKLHYFDPFCKKWTRRKRGQSFRDAVDARTPTRDRDKYEKRTPSFLVRRGFSPC
jgi:hypothetical protein